MNLNCLCSHSHELSSVGHPIVNLWMTWKIPFPGHFDIGGNLGKSYFTNNKYSVSCKVIKLLSVSAGRGM